MGKLEALSGLCVKGLMLAVAVSGAGCSDDDGGLRGDGPRAPVPLAESAQLMADSGMARRARLVIRDLETWKTTWAELVPHGSPRLPKVDFDDFVVVVAAMGEKPYANYQIKVDEVNVEMGFGYIGVTERSPGENCPSLPSTVRPAAVVLVDRFDGEASFGERTVIQPC